MSTKRCPYCHEHISANEYLAHVREHEQLREDGQQNDYVTLPPEARSTEPLNDVPQVYVHVKCGRATGMPPEIIQSYLQNPYLYLADTTFCTGCERQVPNRECQWTETGENLQAYTDRLRLEKPEYRPGLIRRLFVFAVTRNWIK